MKMRAKFLLGWTPSISSDIVEQQVKIVIDGAEQTVSYGRDVEEHTIDVAANSSVLFSVDSLDAEGNVASSVSHSFSVGDLVDPQPATDLFHRMVQKYDADAVEPVPEPEPVPVPEPQPEPQPEPAPPLDLPGE